jgi:hypothetical protein
MHYTQTLVAKLLERDARFRMGTQQGGNDDILRHPWLCDANLDNYIALRTPAPWVPAASIAAISKEQQESEQIAQQLKTAVVRPNQNV